MSIFERVRLLGFGLLAVTFVVGALAGAAIDRAVVGDPEERPRQERRDDDDGDRRRSFIIDRVEMSDAQRQTVDSILERRADRMRAVWREVEPRFHAISDSARSEIMEVLTPEQRAEYEELLERRRDRRRDGDRDDDGKKDRDKDGR